MSNSPTNQSSCYCTSLGNDTPSLMEGTPITNGPNANLLADSLGVSPLYRQQDSARWQSAAQVYQTSRAHSPVPGQQFSFTDISDRDYCLTPQKLSQELIMRAGMNGISSPISLEDIATMNRQKHNDQISGKISTSSTGGRLELEAIAAVHELSGCVKIIAVSEILPRTADLIFVNVKTLEDHPYTLELTLKGWRVASPHSDCMNGDYTQLGLHTRYFQNARQILDVISPGHSNHFHDVLADKLRQYASTESDESDASKTSSDK